jgi:hypothetical protein
MPRPGNRLHLAPHEVEHHHIDEEMDDTDPRRRAGNRRHAMDKKVADQLPCAALPQPVHAQAKPLGDKSRGVHLREALAQECQHIHHDEQRHHGPAASGPARDEWLDTWGTHASKINADNAVVESLCAKKWMIFE